MSDPLPLFRRGVQATLHGLGVAIDEPGDVLRWAQAPERRVVLFTVGQPKDWQVVADLCQSAPDAIVIVVLDDPHADSYVRAVSLGAVSVLPRYATSEDLRDLLEAALRGITMLPTAAVRALTTKVTPPSEADVAPQAHELVWLQALAQGDTVVALADKSGYSERMMFRLLSALYRKLRVSGRTEALMLAKERGWL